MSLNLTSTLLQGYGLYDQLDRLSDMRNDAIEGTDNLAQQALTNTQFKPYTVSSGFGGVTSGPDGIQYNLNPHQQAKSLGLMNQSHKLFGQATADQGAREAQVYDAIRATQIPEEQRAQLLMDDRLLAQGRSGIRSDAYGGTPEQLAYHKAVQESQNQASLMAMQQAEQERMNSGQLGGMLQNAAFMPYAQLQNMQNQGLQNAQLNQAGQLAGANMASQLGVAGLQTALNADVARANLIGNSINSIAGGINGSGFDPIGSGIGMIAEILGLGGGGGDTGEGWSLEGLYDMIGL